MLMTDDFFHNRLDHQCSAPAALNTGFKLESLVKKSIALFVNSNSASKIHKTETILRI